MTNINFSRMFRGKIRTNTCRIIVMTSLVWLLIDVVLIMHYSDCIGNEGWRCKKPGEYDVGVSNFLYLYIHNTYTIVFN